MNREPLRRKRPVRVSQPGHRAGRCFRRPLFELLEQRTLLSIQPIISEFLASNKSGLTDAFGDTSDWIEIYNPDGQQAVDLTGWKLKAGSTAWNFPAMQLGPGEYRIVFASELDHSDPNGELHANFNLNADGGKLRLLDPADAVVCEYVFPAQQPDVSYGTGQQITETKLLAAGAGVRYYVAPAGAPADDGAGRAWNDPAFADAGWATGSTGLGFAGLVPGFAVSNYKSGNTGSIGNLATAQSIVDNPANQSWVQTETASTINYLNTGGAGHFVYDRTYPGLTLGVQASNIVVKAAGKIHIPAAGAYTFGVNSDDGFRLSFPSVAFSSVSGTSTVIVGGAMQVDGGRGAADSLGVVTFASAGDYDVNLLYFQGTGTAELEMFAAPGIFSAWSASTAWRLVGDTVNGGLAVQSYPFTGSRNSVAGAVHTDIRAAMQTATSVYARMAFDAPDLASLQTLTLKLAYDDGFIAYINGVEVARRNATAGGNLAATERTSEVQSSTFETFDITPLLDPANPGHLHLTGNVLAVQVLAAAAGDSDLLLLPEVAQVQSSQLGTHFFATPTPAAANSQQYWLKTEAPQFSVERGMFDAPFPLTLSTPVQSVTKLTRKNATATATVADHGFSDGDVVRIAGAGQSAYNGDFVIGNVTQDTFDFTVAGAPDTPAAGTITAQRLDNIYYTRDGSDPWTNPVLRKATALTASGTTATLTSNNHGFAVGNKVLVSGAVQPEYNGLWTVAGVLDANRFTFTLATAPAVTTATGTVVAERVFLAPTALTSSGRTATATLAGHGLASGDLVRIAGASQAEYNGNFVVTRLDDNRFSYTLASTPSSGTASGAAAFVLGQHYTGPLAIAATSTVRAVVFNAVNYLLSDVVTQTYVFPQDVIQQPANPAGFPGSWDTWPADYQMDPRITTDPAYRNTLVEALRSLPSMSLVTDKTNLFDPTNGIYANTSTSLNSGYNGDPLQTPASLEYFADDGADDFQINAGVQIYGGVGRSPQYKKHSFRLVFKSDYGPSKLDFPLFGADAADSFDSIILRSQFNDAWTWGGTNVQLIRDAFAANTHLAMGEPDHHSTFVNLYVDGLYWGVYQATERPDDDFSAAYMGGDNSDWESNNAGYSNGVTTELPAWNDLMAKTAFGFSTTAYQAGTPGFNTTLYAAGASSTAGFSSTVYRANVAVTNLSGAESVIATPSKQTSTSTATTATLNFLNTGADGHYASGNNFFPGMTSTEVDNFVVETTSYLTIPTAGQWTFGASSNDGFRLTLTNGIDTYTFNNDNTRSSPADKFTTFNIAAAGSYRLRLVYFQNTGGAELEVFCTAGAKSSWDSTFKLLGDAANTMTAYLVTPCTTIAQAEGIINTPALQGWTKTQVVGTLNYLNIGADGHYTSGNLLFPGNASNTPMQNFVLKAESTIAIPTTGTWTFGVSSDDGFRLQLFDGATPILDIASGERTAGDTFGSVNITRAGSYTLRLVYFQSTTASSELELFAAKGSFTAWSGTTAWQLVGSNVTATSNPGLLSLAKVVPVTTLTDAENVLTPATKAVASLSPQTAVTGATMNAATKVVTVTLANHGLANGQTVVIGGADQAAYNGTFVISNVTTNTFDYTALSAAATPATGTLSMQVYGICRSGATAIVYMPGHGFAAGDYITISGAGQGDYNGTFLIAGVTANTCTVNVLNAPTTPGTGSNILVRKAVQAWTSTPNPAPATINYLTTGTDGHYGSNTAFPGTIGGNQVENLVLEAKTSVAIPTAGAWTFAVNSDDGFSLTLTNGTETVTAQYNGVRGAADTFVTLSVATPGTYRLRLVYFQNTGGGEVELYAAPGTWTAWSQTTAWRRVGDVLGGGMGTGLYDTIAVTVYRANVTVDTLAKAQEVVATPSEQSSVATEYRNVLNLVNAGPDGHFAGGAFFPGVAGDEVDNFVVVAQASITIPSGGTYTFGITCDDGFSLTLLDGLTPLTPTFSRSGVGSGGDSLQTYTFAHAGQYTLKLLYYQNAGDAGVELYAAAGAYVAFDTSNFRLIGDTANGGLAVGSGIGPSEMYYVLQGQNPDGTRNPSYPVLLDMNNYIDYMLMNFYTGNSDWPSHNFYAARRNGPDSTGYKFYDWDAEWSVHMNSSLTQNMLGANVMAGRPYFYLLASPEFRLRFADRAQQFMFNGGALTPAASLSRYQALADEVDLAIVLESARWGDVPTGPLPVPHTAAEWRAERDYILNTYLPQRTNIVLGQLRAAGLYPSIDAPSFRINGAAQYGGTFHPGDTLTLAAASGTIYYCTDGSDPRLPGGAVNPNAIAYTGGLALSQTLQIAARALYNGTWTALSEAAFYVDLAPSLRITEVMYHPADPTAVEANAGYVNQDFEYVEIENIGAGAVPLAGARFTSGIDFTFPNVALAPGQYAIVVSNAAAFALRYPGRTGAVVGQYTGHLDNNGERLELDSPAGDRIQSFTYNNTWYAQTDGGAFSLTVRDPRQDAALWDAKDGWRASAAPGGTPGFDDALPPPGAVVVNEVLTHTDPPQYDTIELRNTSTASVDIGGWFLSDSAGRLEKFRIPDGTLLAPGQYATFDGRDFDIVEYAWQSEGIGGVAAAQDAGATLGLTGNGWKRISLRNPLTGQPYRITADTILEFDFQSPLPGELQGIGLDNDAGADVKHADRTFRLDGTNTSWGIGVNPVSVSGPWRHYTIHLGAYAQLLGQDMTCLFFANDDDGEDPDAVIKAQSLFGNVQVYEDGQTAAAVDFGRYFGLNGAAGDDVYVSSNAGETAGGYRTHVDFGPLPNGVSAGRYTSSAGTDFTLLATPTFGTANGTPYVAPLAFNEIMYHPADPTPAEWAAGFYNAEDFEFVELHNRSETPLQVGDFYVGGGLGFTFGWYADGSGYAGNSESATLERGATASWTTAGLGSDTYTVYAHLTLLDGNGRRRSLDDAALYTIDTDAGPVTVSIDQNQPGVVDSDVWVSLGTYAFNDAGAVHLARGTVSPENWTQADAVRFSKPGTDVVVSAPVLDSLATRSGLGVVAPGGYVVLVGNYAAFDARYHVAANQIPVAGEYTGHLSNGGDTLRLYRADRSDPGLVPYYQIDRVAYGTRGDWPETPDGGGPSLIRIHPAGYGNDPANWRAGAVGGTPGQPNVPHDKTPPSTPTQLAAQLAISPDNRITLTWTASLDRESSVDHYVVYRDGVAVGTTTAVTHVDSGLQATTAYVYRVTAVNRDGYESGLSTPLTATLPGIVYYSTPDGHIEVVFSEALSVGPATLPSNFSINGAAPASATLADNNTKLLLVPQSPLSVGGAYTVAMNHLTAQSGRPLPDALQVAFTYVPQGSGYILREYWTGIAGGNVSDLTGNANYPNNPTGTTYPSSLEGPLNWTTNCGTRMRGYVSPPVSGTYYFWLAADDTAELWLSTDADPANKVKISSVTAATAYRGWTSKSAGIALTAGQRYYIEVLQKQGTGSDNCSVRWQLPDGSWENGDQNAPIPGIRLSPFGALPDVAPPTVPDNLAAEIVNDNTQIRLSWSAATDPESSVAQYAIYRDGVKYGTSATASFVDAGVSAAVRHRYQVAAVNSAGFESPPSTPLSMSLQGIASAACWSATSLQAAFSEPVDRIAAETASNYALNYGVVVLGAHLESDNMTVTLATTAIPSNTLCTLTVNGLYTRFGDAMAGDMQQTFVLGGAIYREYWTGLSSSNVLTDLTGSPNYPDNPSGSQYLTQYFESPTNWGTNAGERLRGYILPDVSGTYYFWIASDDNGSLRLSTAAGHTEDPAYAVQIAYVDASTGSRQWTWNQTKQKSAGINLVAGQRYYIEALMKQGGGNCNLAVAWQRPGETFNTSGGLPMAASYLQPYIASANLVSLPLGVANDPRDTSDTTPALNGTVSDPAAIVTVRVGGVYYAAVNDGNAWQLPAGSWRSPLADGTYQVTTSVVDVAGRLGFSASPNDLIVDTVAPTLQLAGLGSSPRFAPVPQIQFVFSEPVDGLSLADLRLTRDDGANLLTGYETLTTTDRRTWTLGGLAAATAHTGTYVLALPLAGANIEDGAENPLDAGLSATWVMSSSVVDRLVFYNRSAFDGGDAAANAADDAAVATDKQALLPGGTATLANYTSYTRGINGIMVDLAGVADPAAITANDFTFRVGNAPDNWSAAPAPTDVTVRSVANGTVRVTIVWNDNDIQNQWLQVTVKATANTGLAADDVFYFGNAVGDSGAGNTPLYALVDQADELAVRAHRTGFAPTSITNVYDFDRDRRVGASDELAPRYLPAAADTALRLIAPPNAAALAFAAVAATVVAAPSVADVPAVVPTAVPAEQTSAPTLPSVAAVPAEPTSVATLPSVTTVPALQTGIVTTASVAAAAVPAAPLVKNSAVPTRPTRAPVAHDEALASVSWLWAYEWDRVGPHKSAPKKDSAVASPVDRVLASDWAQ